MTNALPFSRAAATAGIIAVAFGMLVAGASDSSAERRPTLTAANCTSEWNRNSAARTYCSNPTISVTDNQCELDGSCSITATVTDADGGTADTTWTPSMDLTLEKNKVSGIDICFKKNSAGTAFSAEVKDQCATGETGSKTATEDGLSL